MVNYLPLVKLVKDLQLEILEGSQWLRDVDQMDVNI